MKNPKPVKIKTFVKTPQYKTFIADQMKTGAQREGIGSSPTAAFFETTKIGKSELGKKDITTATLDFIRAILTSNI